MVKTTIMVLYFVVMIAIIVSVDFLFLRNKFWQRLIFNVAVVLLFLAIFLEFLNK